MSHLMPRMDTKSTVHSGTTPSSSRWPRLSPAHPRSGWPSHNAHGGCFCFYHKDLTENVYRAVFTSWTYSKRSGRCPNVFNSGFAPQDPQDFVFGPSPMLIGREMNPIASRSVSATFRHRRVKIPGDSRSSGRWQGASKQLL
jgi:hypothetical protein